MLLYGKPVAQAIEQSMISYIQTHTLGETYVLFLLLNDTRPSRVYIDLKLAAARRIGISTRLVDDVSLSIEDVLSLIGQANQDDLCIGIIVQLPLPDHLVAEKQTILSAISDNKDIDGLNYQQSHILPATPRAVLEILSYYKFYELADKHIVVIGQSQLIGAPLADELENMEAHVDRFDVSHSPKEIQLACKSADIVISATGALHMIDLAYTRTTCDQIFIDVGRGILDGKAVGDMQWQILQDHVLAITPVPGGIGPVTVASLFQNIKYLHQKTYI